MIGVTVPLFGLGKLVCSANAVLRVLSEQANILSLVQQLCVQYVFASQLLTFPTITYVVCTKNVLGWLVYRSCVCVFVCVTESPCA